MKRVIRLFPWRRQAVQGEQLPKRYAKSPEGRTIVRLSLSSPAALLMPFDSFPAHFGSAAESEACPSVLNLNQDLVDYLFARLAELDEAEPLLLRVSLPANDLADPTVPTPGDSIQELQVAIHRYFAYLESTRRENLKQLARDACLLGLLGTGALGLSVVLEGSPVNPQASFALPLLNQGVTVFGWLTFWEALANALWNWRPLYRQLRMCQRLQQAPLELDAL
ncbi:MAG: hypothetical protein HC800_01970 [Phormidesmis sp. RL_2_1]|nr:hypothetical protein [Phormidesmis sp. RL_2_1]